MLSKTYYAHNYAGIIGLGLGVVLVLKGIKLDIIIKSTTLRFKPIKVTSGHKVSTL